MEQGAYLRGFYQKDKKEGSNEKTRFKQFGWRWLIAQIVLTPMNITEVALTLGKSESTILRNFART
jgi:hypothetical protein